MDPETLSFVASRLQPVDEKFAFIGGAIIPFLLDNPSITPIRPTQDVDLIIKIVTRIAYFKLEDRMRKIGFKHDMSAGAPKCRWIVDGAKVDVMPIGGEAAEMKSKWFPEALDASEEIELEDRGISANIVTAPFFIATKLEAFFDRGDHDFYGSPDLEDIVTILDGRSSIFDEIAELPENIRTYVSKQFRILIDNQGFREALPGHLPPDPASQARLPQLLDLLERLAELPD